MSFSAVLGGAVRFHVEHGSALECLKLIPDNSVDAVVTDPPAGIKFMGKQWDGAKGGRAQWVAWLSEILAKCYRVTKPGGRMLCWSIPRTMHWTGCAIEDAGWEIENTIAHIFGSGFPKAKTQLKPAREDWWLARKPAKHVLPLNIDECRIAPGTSVNGGGNNFDAWRSGEGRDDRPQAHGERSDGHKNGRWPANLVLSHADGCVRLGSKRVKATSIHGEDVAVRRTGAHADAGGHQTIGREQPVRGYADADGKESVEDWRCADGCAVAELDRQSGTTTSGAMKREVPAYDGESNTAFLRGRSGPSNQHGDSGGASRFFNTFEPDLDEAPFFYCAKASRSDRNEGCEEVGNKHVTVKPNKLMRHLCKLVTPPGGVVLDCFFGSGSTGKAALAEGYRVIGIEQDADSVATARARCAHEVGKLPAQPKPVEPGQGHLF